MFQAGAPDRCAGIGRLRLQTTVGGTCDQEIQDECEERGRSHDRRRRERGPAVEAGRHQSARYGTRD